MAEVSGERAVCENCGVDVRENTAFCYNCGVSVLPDEPVSELGDTADEAVDPKTKAALEDLSERLKKGEEDDAKLAKAAAERRKARTRQRKPSEFTWEPDEEGVDPKLLIAVGLVALVAGVIVLTLIFWK